MVDPATNGFIGDSNAAFRQQIFDVTKAQGETQIEPDRRLDDFGRKPVLLVADFLHSLGQRTVSEAASPNCRDNALVSPPAFPRMARFSTSLKLKTGPDALCLMSRKPLPRVSRLARSCRIAREIDE